MTRHLSLCVSLVSLAVVVAAGCASPSNTNPTGTAGTMGTGGSGNTGGSGTGGSAPLPAGLGQGGPFPFPQSKKPGSCSITTVANAAGAANTAYMNWKGKFVTSSGAGGFLRVQRDSSSSNDTVSEGIGYGMIAAVYMSDRPTFDGLWSYAKSHFNSDGLMSWQISSSGSVVGMNSATDADEDMAWALLMASDQWNSTTYLDDGRAVIDAIYGTAVAGDGMIKPDKYGGANNGTTYDPDYFAPAYYRVFARATDNPVWSGMIIDRNYALLAQLSGPHGLVPNSTDTGTFSTTNNYGYNSCRMPWRIAMDYCFNGETRAKTYLDLIGTFFNGISGGAANIGDGYSNSGSQTSGNHNSAFIGPAGTAGMAGYPTLLDGAFNYGAANNTSDNVYFPSSLRAVTMLMMSGNFLDYSHQ